MRLTVINELNDLQRKLIGYVCVLSYRYCLLSVNAEPSALLAIEEEEAGREYKMEDLVRVYPHEKEEEKQIMDLFPLRAEYLSMIVRAIKTNFPEYELTIEKYNRYEDDETKDNCDENKYVRLTMPEVDKDRKDLLTNAVDVQHDVCVASMTAAETQATAKITALTIADDPSALKEAKDGMKQIVEEADKMREELTSDKKKEIDEAYERYLKNGGTQGSSSGSSGSGSSGSGSGKPEVKKPEVKADALKNVGKSLKL